MTLNLDAIEARANAAALGPWHITPVAADEANVCIEHDHFDLWRWEGAIADVKVKPGLTTGEVRQTEVNVACILCDALPDAEFIAHARTDVPALVAEVRRLRLQVKAAERHGE